MSESRYQAYLIKELKQRIPNCVILKNDASYLQGVPDIIILFEDRWAMLEIKKGPRSPSQPNQEYYISLLNKMSFASFIDPDSEEDVLYELQRSFGLAR